MTTPITALLPGLFPSGRFLPAPLGGLGPEALSLLRLADDLVRDAE